MSVSGISLGTAGYAPSVRSEPAFAKQSAAPTASDPDHDGDVDVAGAKDVDSGSSGRVNVLA